MTDPREFDARSQVSSTQDDKFRLLDDQYLALLETYATSPVVSDAQLAAVARQDLPGLIARLRQLLMLNRRPRSLMDENDGVAGHPVNSEVVL
jgi:hypothetical protein